MKNKKFNNFLDKQLVDKIFETAPREKILKTSNSKKSAQKKKR